MVRKRALSPTARAVLANLLESGDAWRHGYDLCHSTGVKSGSLYPLLIRLEEQGFLEAEWQAPAGPGRPPRHAYRLTGLGRELARKNRPEPETTPLRLAPETGR